MGDSVEVLVISAHCRNIILYVGVSCRTFAFFNCGRPSRLVTRIYEGTLGRWIRLKSTWLLGDLLGLLSTLLFVSRAAMRTLQERLALPVRICNWFIKAAVQVLAKLRSLRLRSLETTILVYLALVRGTDRLTEKTLIAWEFSFLVKIDYITHVLIFLGHVVWFIRLIYALGYGSPHRLVFVLLRALVISTATLRYWTIGGCELSWYRKVSSFRSLMLSAFQICVWRKLVLFAKFFLSMAASQFILAVLGATASCTAAPACLVWDITFIFGLPMSLALVTDLVSNEARFVFLCLLTWTWAFGGKIIVLSCCWSRRASVGGLWSTTFCQTRFELFRLQGRIHSC